MANLTIRNVTVNPLELVTVERFESEKENVGGTLSSLTGKFSSLMNATDYQSHNIVAKGKPNSKDDVNIRIDSFKAKKTDVRTADADREVLRLTFKSKDKKYQIDIPTPNTKSSTMKKLDGGSQELTVIYVPTGAFLAVFSSAKLNSWMRELHNDWPLQILSIPGTHNAPTCHKALPSVRCQAVGVPEQLDNGVRFLDIRITCDPDDDTLYLVHGAFPVALSGSKYFGDMCQEIYAFLEKNPSETVIMSVKREGTGKANDEQAAKHLKKAYIDKKKDRWFTEPRVPKLGEARGKILLMRRMNIDDELKKCHDGKGFGINAKAWPDNCEDGKIGKAGHIRVQDFYEVTESQNIEKKIDFSRGHLERAAEQFFCLSKPEAAMPPFFVNFLSASNFFNATCWPERIAAKVNPAIIEYLCIKHGEGGQGPKKLKAGCCSTGIVVTDWVGYNDDWDLIRCIVGMNAMLIAKK